MNRVTFRIAIAATFTFAAFCPANAQRPVQSYPYGQNTLWVPVEFYPPDALTAKQEGVLVADLARGADGLITGCTVVQSSGHRSLDEASCRLSIGTRIADHRSGLLRTEFFWRIPTTPTTADFGGAIPISPIYNFGSDDYPWVMAKANGRDVSVELHFTVAATGRVTGCAGKTKVELVGERSCALLMKRGRFLAARGTTQATAVQTVHFRR
jgi:hypothetical protein